MIDLGYQLNLATKNDIPSFYWEKTVEMGIEIEGTHVQLLGKADKFPVSFNGIKSELSLSRLDNMNDDYILGSEFLQQVMPTSMDMKNMVFKFCLKGIIFCCPLSFEWKHRCKSLHVQPKKT